MPATADKPFVLLDDNRSHGSGHRLLFRSPLELLTCASPNQLDGFFARMEAALTEGHHLAGWFAYEAGYGLEPKLAPLAPPAGDMPLAWFGVFAAPEITHGATPADVPCRRSGEEISLDRLCPTIDRAAYDVAISAIKDYLLAGDVYQINYTFPLTFSLQGRPADLFTQLRQAQPVAFGAHIHTPAWDILSLSPELFFEKRGADLTARPMKGTARRGLSMVEDDQLAAALKADPKSQAENLMIVDLLRNDLSRIARPGSVEVPTLFEVEKYRTLLQMTSTVTAKVDPDIPLKTLFHSLFPCGSVTGAPKIRAMEIIHELERRRRGVYTGAIGHITPERDITFSVPIRTLTLRPESPSARRWAGSLGIGSGIVADSETGAEYEECLLKGRFLTAPPPNFDLLETFLWQPDKGFQHLEAHLERLASAADYFDFIFDRAAVLAGLAELAQTLSAKPQRVRLMVSKSGGIAVTAAPQGEAPLRPSVVLSVVTVSSGDPLLRHKTTARQVYDDALGDARKRGAFEAILTNERGEITEGCFSNVFVEKGGRLLTPALSAGLLPGILRHQLVRNGKAEEATLYPSDLTSADKVYIGNSLRGLMAVTLKARP